ncbi:hypothetical protein X559_1707 [Paenilisteria newyorkensis]|nr:hypothetical protein X559_1707 [Listeria newyorkensis]
MKFSYFVALTIFVSSTLPVMSYAVNVTLSVVFKITVFA